jgi:RNA polymerase sigma-70 factor, ECF subfamily
VRQALSVVIDRLSPAERTSFVLHDIFGIPFDTVAGLAEGFIAVCEGGDVHGLIGLLDPEAAGFPVVIGIDDRNGPMAPPRTSGMSSRLNCH